MAVEKVKRKRITKKFKKEQLDKIYSFGIEGALKAELPEFEDPAKATYNEVLQSGAESMIRFFASAMGKKAVFYDLGCGQGKLIMHLAIETKMSKITGIELNKERFSQAVTISEEVEFPQTQPQIINADFRNVDLSDATIVYFDPIGYTLEETAEVVSLLPPGCLLIYRHHGAFTGDAFFPMRSLASSISNDSDLKNFWAQMASYRVIT